MDMSEQEIKPEQIIYIPNYKNKQPKIIKMSDLTKLRLTVPGGRTSSMLSEGYMTSKNKVQSN
jgi:hypothetical protein